MLLLAFLFFFPLIASQSCKTGGEGPCLNGACPGEGLSCTTGEVCCRNEDILLGGGEPSIPEPIAPVLPPVVAPPVIPPVAPPVAPVVAPVAPVVVPASSNCFDNAKIRCANYKQYCSKKEYKFLLTQHCSLTCNFCPSGGSPAVPAPIPASVGSTFTGGSSSCVDRGGSKFGKSNCPSISQFCTHAKYKDIMASQCPKTCGFC